MACTRSPNVPPCPAIVQWEKAGASLVTALEDYMGLCLHLGTDSLREGVDSKDLASRVDSTLATVHTAMSHHLNQSKSTLARTRNKLASPFFRLPEELVSEIFDNVVFDRSDPTSFGLRSLEHDGRMIYHRLYSLLEVCPVWRDLILTRGVLWSIIPIFQSRSDEKNKAVKRILQRAGGSPLHLAASMTWRTPSRLTKVITEYGPRFHMANISASGRRVIREAIHNLLQHDTRLSLSELSMQLENASTVNPRMPTEFDFLISHDHSNYASFARLMEKLMVFRISGIHIHWDFVAYSTRLVELWIEKVAIGYDNAVAPFIRALSSAPNLRDLKIISVSTFCDLDATDERNSLAPITFPSLESLFLQDLYFNTLEHLLPTIFPGSYRLTLFLTRKILTRGAPGDEAEDFEPQLIGVHELGSVLALAQTRVDTLMLSGGISDDCWLTGPELRALLLSIPTVKTLKLHNWDLDQTVWRALRRSPASRSHSEHHQFPALENLHFYYAKIHNQRGLKNMMTSHPIQKMVLGVARTDVGDVLSEWLCDEDDSIITWFKANIPAFHLVNSTYQPSEFYSHMWQLW